ncbi:MAG: type II toxin-antitoxin system death-on-curing family toxin [Verrucomicrobiota bacterium]
MKESIWIEEHECLSLHEDALARYGGSSGLRDPGLLESALNRPKHIFAYESDDLFTLAAALAAGIILNHPFLDGNKRTGFLAGALFLEVNGLRFQASEEAVLERTLALAARAIDEAEYRAFLEAACQPPDSSA